MGGKSWEHYSFNFWLLTILPFRSSIFIFCRNISEGYFWTMNTAMWHLLWKVIDSMPTKLSWLPDQSIFGKIKSRNLTCSKFLCLISIFIKSFHLIYCFSLQSSTLWWNERISIMRNRTKGYTINSVQTSFTIYLHGPYDTGQPKRWTYSWNTRPGS